ncbi:MAG: hypothetical protein GC179_17610 [Anaerolineaceae bacterium]|nr:hypothetical protein [Anaerolineaceae bacterium]
MTNPIPEQIATICVGVLLLIMGSLLIQRKRMNIPIGRPRPLFIIPLRGIGALIFGATGILCGISVIGFVLFSLTPNGSGSWANASLTLQIIIVGGLILGFGVGFVMQVLMFLIDGVSKNNK